MTFVSFSLCTILVTFIWLRYRRQQFFVWKLLGYQTNWKVIEIAKRYYKVAFAGYIAGVIIMKLILFNINDFNILTSDMIKALSVTIGLGTIMLFWGILLRND